MSTLNQPLSYLKVTLKASINKTAIVVGATGVVGCELVKQLCTDGTFDQVITLGRRTINFHSDKLTQHIVDFSTPKSWQHLVVADTLFCALGTTLKQAGSKPAQQSIDLDLPKLIAKTAKSNGVNNFALVSSVGADASSSSFYLSLKGKLEQYLQQLNFITVTIVQPSVLDAKRNEFRFGEEVAIKLLKALQFLPGLKQYRPIKAGLVAKALLFYQRQNNSGLIVKKLDELFI